MGNIIPDPDIPIDTNAAYMVKIIQYDCDPSGGGAPDVYKSTITIPTVGADLISWIASGKNGVCGWGYPGDPYYALKNFLIDYWLQ